MLTLKLLFFDLFPVSNVVRKWRYVLLFRYENVVIHKKSGEDKAAGFFLPFIESPKLFTVTVLFLKGGLRLITTKIMMLFADG